MAVTTDGWFSNAIQGVPQVGGEFSIYDKDANAKFAIGTRFTRQDGNEYTYSHFGADTTPGLLVSTDQSESSVVETDNKVIASASSVNTNDSLIGSKFSQITLASVTQDQFAGGYLTITDGIGLGYTYRIKANDATGDTATGDVRFELYEPLQLALTTASDISIQGPIFANLEVATAGTDAVIAGVSVSNMDVSVAAYGWVATKGVAPISVDATDITFGTVVALSADVAGNIYAVADAVTDAAIVADEEIVGVALDTPDDNSFVLTKLKIW